MKVEIVVLKHPDSQTSQNLAAIPKNRFGRLPTNFKILGHWLLKANKLFERVAFLIQYYVKKSIYLAKKRAPLVNKEHLSSFPAISLKQLDKVDFIFKFSSELLVFILALVVGVMNLYFYGGFSKKTYSDHSFAAKFLNYHPQLNDKLYAKNSTIVTTISERGGLLPEALAESYTTPLADPLTEDPFNQDGYYTFINDNVLVKPNPDSIQSLIDKQIKVYETQVGDTLSSIAAANGISVKTLMWANNLQSETIRPGWFLLILPVNGVVYKATTNDTLPDIAKKYHGDLAKIIAYNGLENAEDIDGGQLIIIPDGSMPQPPATPRSQNGSLRKGENIQRPQYVNNGTGHIFPWGYCTWYVASRIHIPWGGNAKNWLTNAKAYGAVITKEPSVGAIVVTTDNRRYGHVAYVEKIENDRFMVSEMNYEAFGKVNTRWINKDSRTIRGFILH